MTVNRWHTNPDPALRNSGDTIDTHQQRVMPKSKLYGIDHSKVSQERALSEQRRAVAEHYRKRLSKKISAEKAQ